MGSGVRLPVDENGRPIPILGSDPTETILEASVLDFDDGSYVPFEKTIVPGAVYELTVNGEISFTDFTRVGIDFKNAAGARIGGAAKSFSVQAGQFLVYQFKVLPDQVTTYFDNFSGPGAAETRHFSLRRLR